MDSLIILSLTFSFIALTYSVYAYYDTKKLKNKLDQKNKNSKKG